MRSVGQREILVNIRKKSKKVEDVQKGARIQGFLTHSSHVTKGCFKYGERYYFQTNQNSDVFGQLNL
jgi:hypothetical protein